jgi:hypothetical protein
MFRMVNDDAGASIDENDHLGRQQVDAAAVRCLVRNSWVDEHCSCRLAVQRSFCFGRGLAPWRGTAARTAQIKCRIAVLCSALVRQVSRRKD